MFCIIIKDDSKWSSYLFYSSFHVNISLIQPFNSIELLRGNSLNEWNLDGKPVFKMAAETIWSFCLHCQDRFSIVTVNERVHVPSQRNHIAGTFVAGERIVYSLDWSVLLSLTWKLMLIIYEKGLMELTNDKGVMGVEDPWVDMGQGTSGNAYFVYPWCGMVCSGANKQSLLFSFSFYSVSILIFLPTLDAVRSWQSTNTILKSEFGWIFESNLIRPPFCFLLIISFDCSD